MGIARGRSAEVGIVAKATEPVVNQLVKKRMALGASSVDRRSPNHAGGRWTSGIPPRFDLQSGSVNCAACALSMLSLPPFTGSIFKGLAGRRTSYFLFIMSAGAAEIVGRMTAPDTTESRFSSATSHMLTQVVNKPADVFGHEPADGPRRVHAHHYPAGGVEHEPG